MTFSRIRRSATLVGASLAMILGQAVLAAPVAAAGPWTTAFTLASATKYGNVADLSAAGKFVASAWVQENSPPASVWVRESLNSGTTWLPPVRLAASPSMWASEISLTSEAASGQHFAVWQEAIAGGHTRIFMSKKSFGSGAWAVPVQVSTNPGTTDAWVPSLVVTPAYYFLAYMQTLADGSNAAARLRVFDRGTGLWNPSISLGGTGSYVKLAATSSRVAAVWANASGVIKLRRGTMGLNGGLAWSPTLTLGSGETPFVVLSGTRGVVGWVKNGDVFTRRTTSSGASWSLAATVLNGSVIQPYAFFDGAMYGLKVVLTGQYTQVMTEIGSTGIGFRMTSADGGATWAQTQSHPCLGDNRQVAYTAKLSSGAFRVVAEAWTNRLSDDDGGPDKVSFHRHT